MTDTGINGGDETQMMMVMGILKREIVMITMDEFSQALQIFRRWD